uniref:hypothetical protein n=1 Tax=Alicyclobacillus tolerans TaxID=90970 RepID=UPI001F31FAE5|nr:hypothetical protein [Alicyclobacillus tolerans]
MGRAVGAAAVLERLVAVQTDWPDYMHSRGPAAAVSCLVATRSGGPKDSLAWVQADLFAAQRSLGSTGPWSDWVRAFGCDPDRQSFDRGKKPFVLAGDVEHLAVQLSGYLHSWGLISWQTD